MKRIDLLKWTSVIASLVGKTTLSGIMLAAVLCISISSAFSADDVLIIDNLPNELDLLDLEDLDSIGAPIDVDALSNENNLPSPSTTDLPDAILPDTVNVEQSVEPEPEPEPKINTSSAKVNVVEVNETYYLLRFDKNSNTYLRSITQEANPGDLIEIQITATNLSDQVVKEVEMVNSIPTGPVSFIADSITLDEKQGFYRISTTGNTFFPPEAEIAASDIQFIKWQIFSLGIKSTLTLSYQIKINN